MTETPTQGATPGQLLHRRRHRRAPTRRPGRSTSPSTARSTPTRSRQIRSSSTTWAATPPAARPGHQPGRQADLRQRDRHACHQPGRRRADARNRRLPDHPLRQRLAGHHQPAGHRPRRREHRRRHVDRRPARPPLGQRLPRRQLLRLVHHQHHAAVGLAGSLKLIPPATPTSSATTSRSRPRRPSTARSASPTRTRARRRTDGDPRRRHRRAGQRRPDDLLRPEPAPGQPQQSGPVHPPERGHRALRRPAAPSRSRVGVDAANTGLVTNTSPCPTCRFYNVGPDGLLSPLPGDDSGYYVARVRVIDQSGNQSNPNDPNAQVPFVVDTTPPTVEFTTPTPGQVITSLGANGQISSRSRPARTST